MTTVGSGDVGNKSMAEALRGLNGDLKALSQVTSGENMIGLVGSKDGNWDKFLKQLQSLGSKPRTMGVSTERVGLPQDQMRLVCASGAAKRAFAERN